jgi:hypothetical protein
LGLQLNDLFQNFGIRQFLELWRKRIDRADERLNHLEVALVLGADKPGNNPVNHGINSHHNPLGFFGLNFLLQRRANDPAWSCRCAQHEASDT